jgi:hypothetical protein
VPILVVSMMFGWATAPGAAVRLPHVRGQLRCSASSTTGTGRCSA